MIDDTGSTDTPDQLGMEPGSWSTVTGTLPTNLPAANQAGSAAQVAAAAAGGVVPIAAASTTSSVTKVAIGLGIGAVLLGLLAVAAGPPKRRR